VDAGGGGTSGKQLITLLGGGVTSGNNGQHIAGLCVSSGNSDQHIAGGLTSGNTDQSLFAGRKTLPVTGSLHYGEVGGGASVYRGGKEVIFRRVVK
jgi:hypothetical protein